MNTRNLRHGMGLLALLGGMGVLTSAGCASAPSVGTLEMAPPPSVARAPGLGAVTVTELVDMRPGALVDTFGPHVESTYYVLMIGSGGLYIDGNRVEGAYLHGDARTMQAAAVDTLVGGLTGAASRVALPSGALASNDPRAALEAVGVRDGTLIIPILDQMDAVSLFSKNTMVGGSSTEVGRSTSTVTMRQTIGAATMSGSTPTWFNLRVRLLVGELRAGRVTSMRWVYGRGHGQKGPKAWATLAASLRDGLAPAPPEPRAEPVDEAPAEPSILPDPEGVAP